MEDFFPEMEVVNEGRAPGPDTQCILIVSNRSTLRRRQYWMSVFGKLMKFAALPPMKLLIVDRRFIGW
jgi:hypothetical protein